MLRFSTVARTAGILVLGATLVSWRGGLQAQDFELAEATIADVHAAIASGDATCEDILMHYLQRMAMSRHQRPRLNAIGEVNPGALTHARRLDSLIVAGAPTGPLHCIPVLIKDQVETRDMPTTYGSALFEEFVPRRNATIVDRLLAAGAIILAKTNMGEFASRYVGSGFGVIRNAYNRMRNPSGSSGGTGAGVAANLGMVGIGEDTGGSIRGPAAVHALVGLRPTLELVSRYGMMPANPSTDTMGPMTRTVMDAAIVLDVIAGYDPNDPVTAESVGHIPDSYTDALDSAGLAGARIGVIRDPMDRRVGTTTEGFRQVRSRVNAALEDMRTLGAEVVDSVDISGIDEVNEIFGLNSYETEEATDAYLADHDHAPYQTLSSILLTGRVNPWRASGMAGLLGKTTRDPGYLEYLQRRDQIRVNVLKVMADLELDALVYATFDHPPTSIAEDVETNPRPRDNYGLGDNRLLSPLTGFPAVTVPAGFTPDGLPVGIEFMSRPFTEAMLLKFAYAYEQETMHRRPPRLGR